MIIRIENKISKEIKNYIIKKKNQKFQDKNGKIFHLFSLFEHLLMNSK